MKRVGWEAEASKGGRVSVKVKKNFRVAATAAKRQDNAVSAPQFIFLKIEHTHIMSPSHISHKITCFDACFFFSFLKIPLQVPSILSMPRLHAKSIKR